MKYFTKVMLITLVVVALAVMACSPRPLPVTENQYQTARQEAIDNEERVKELENEKAELEAALGYRPSTSTRTPSRQTSDEAEFIYLSEAEYRSLSSCDRRDYYEAMIAEMAALQSIKSETNATIAYLEREIEELRRQLLAQRGTEDDPFAAFRAKLRYYDEQLRIWERKSNEELIRDADDFIVLRDSFYETCEEEEASYPIFQEEIANLESRFNAIGSAIDRAKLASATTGDTSDSRNLPGTYTVQKDDWLSKISSYDFIYGDWRKWPDIYDANKHQIRDPNLIFPNQILIIPR